MEKKIDNINMDFDNTELWSSKILVRGNCDHKNGLMPLNIKTQQHTQ